MHSTVLKVEAADTVALGRQHEQAVGCQLCLADHRHVGMRAGARQATHSPPVPCKFEREGLPLRPHGHPTPPHTHAPSTTACTSSYCPAAGAAHSGRSPPPPPPPPAVPKGEAGRLLAGLPRS